MRAGRLKLTLYLGAFVITFVAAGLILAFSAIKPPNMVPPPDPHTVGIELARVQRAPARLAEQLANFAADGIEVTAYDTDHHVVASTVQPPIPRGLADEPWTAHQVVSDAGITLEVFVRPRGPSMLHGPPPRQILVPLAVLLTALILLVVVIVRHLGKPLQQLENAAKRFGSGDLSARARIARSDEFGVVGRAFDLMADRVTALMVAQRELMANVSHELHTPLSRIQVAVDLMVDGIDTRATELLPQIARDLAELQRLIDDIMALSRFELARVRDGAVAVPVTTEVVSIAQVVHEAIERFQARHADRAIEPVIPAGPHPVLIDRMLVRRVLENLLDNAAKYSDPKAAIGVSVGDGPDGVSVCIRDGGIGIDVEDLPQVFTPFFRSDRSRSRATGGFGLGLAFARRVVEAHGGSISIVSEPEVGTTVTFVLPRSDTRG